MLDNFCTPYFDELFISLLSRYQIYTGNFKARQTRIDLFGADNVRIAYDLPLHITDLIERLPWGSTLTAEDMFLGHTLFPFYATFLFDEKADKLREQLLSNQHFARNLVGNRISSLQLLRFYRFCPKCVKEDWEMYGEIYWHRLHHTPGVYICPKHETVLKDSHVPIHCGLSTKFYAAAPENCSDDAADVIDDNSFIPFLLEMARDVQWILTNEPDSFPSGFFRERYVQLLRQKGYMNTQLNRRKLARDFIDYFGASFLSFMQSELKLNKSTDNWLISMFRPDKDKVTNPVHHLLLFQFLGITAEDFFLKLPDILDSSPFGNDPWICHNPASNHFGSRVVTDLVVSRKSATRFYGVFYCSCGFVYSRWSNQAEDVFRVVRYGSTWDDYLTRLFQEESCTIQKAQRKLNICYYSLRLQMERLGLHSKRSKKCPTVLVSERTRPIDGRDEQRYVWLELQTKQDFLTASELKKKRNVYDWLQRHDPAWLREHLNRKGTGRRPRQHQFINWENRDEEMLCGVQSVVSDMMRFTWERPEAITIASVGRRLRGRSIYKILEKLPKTHSYLQSVVDTRESFHQRRMRWAAWYLRQIGERVTKSKIQKASGVHASISETTKHLIAEEVERYRRVNECSLS